MNTDRSGRRGVGWVLAIFVLSTVLPSLGLLLGTPTVRAACAAPCVELLSPNGGEDLTGGSAPAITFLLDSVSGSPAVPRGSLFYAGAPARPRAGAGGRRGRHPRAHPPKSASPPPSSPPPPTTPRPRACASGWRSSGRGRCT